MSYSFDYMLERSGTSCTKYGALKSVFKRDDLLPMWIADSDFVSPDFIIDTIKKRLSHPIFGYTFADDKKYNAISKWYEKTKGFSMLNRDNILITEGIIKTISGIINAFTKIGDKIILQTPVYSPFYKIINLNERVVSKNSLKESDDRYSMDFDSLKKLAKDATMMILCSPHNPTGRCFSKDELAEVVKICKQNDVLIVSDEIHSDLILRENRHTPILDVNSDARDISIMLHSPSKTFNIPGLNISYAVAMNKSIKERLSNAVDRFCLWGANIFSLELLQAVYERGYGWLCNELKYIESNIDYSTSFIKEYMPKIRYSKSEATYLLWLDFRALGLTQNELEDLIHSKAKVGLSSGVIYGDDGTGFMRANLSTQRENVKIMLNRLKNIL